MVESSIGAVAIGRGELPLPAAFAYSAGASAHTMLRLRCPLIEPDVTISVIRLSDGFHIEACTYPRRESCSNDITPSSPKMVAFENWR